ncbi:LytR/AlgR family response regulator transcription factor [Algoriphagus aquimarinus]|uniref:Two component transcriptional regulator, LytTR family n=1 Tax=Algoriphagus aquimarinus TaxID=237018 RepID=A0A1I1C1J7_9BACT|nr:LytTR family DNA-binding domain-containing protein [Algoriphagus aquimarinus]SFB56495.1 two component transcriptional regulator, LytTR family [Algoriphagus aquimarinus]
MIRVVIIDDEPKAIISLEWELKQLGELVEVVGKFGEAEQALQELETLRPDCIFLDIEMPDLDGFKFLGHFPNRSFEVIFVTAHAEHAIQAIRESAFDYLLKPVDQADLESLLKRIHTKLNNKSINSASNNTALEKEKIVINMDDQLLVLDPDEVIYCESEGSYSYIHTLNGGKVLVSKRLKLLDNLFSKYKFYRIHHSFLINLGMVKAYEKSTGKVKLIDGISLPVSRLKKAGFTESLK